LADLEVWRIDLTSKRARVLLTTDDLYDFAISPDGTRLACEHAGGLWLLDIDIDRPVLRRLIAKGHGPAWSPDGSRIAFMTRDATLSIADVGTGKSTKLVSRSSERGSPYRGGWARRPVWSSDGQLLWFNATTSSVTTSHGILGFSRGSGRNTARTHANSAMRRSKLIGSSTTALGSSTFRIGRSG
jgi:hypothetical protein